MFRITHPALAFVAVALCLAGPRSARAQTACITPHVSGATNQGSICLVAALPDDADLSRAKTYADKRLAFHIWAWNTFLALNTPVGPQRGVPAPGKTPADPGTRVWESYKTSAETYPHPPAIPTAWDAPVPPPSPPAGCPASSGPLPVLSVADKGDDPALSEVTQPMSGKFGHLIDQNGNLVYLDALTNRPSYEFVVNNKFYDADVQATASQGQLLFPSGDRKTGAVPPIDLKPAWKVLAGKDNAATFYHRQAYVIDPVTRNCTIETVGLVGFHITAKTVTAPQWIWATFEHKDNAPDCAYPNGAASGCKPVSSQDHYSFYNPGCSACAINQLPTDTASRTPAQVARIVAIPADVKSVNTQVAALLKGSVWENYVLVDAQFPQSPDLLYGNPAPIALANSTLETFNQGASPATQTSSCLGCHFLAAPAGRSAGSTFSDFDWQMGKAKSYAGKTP